MRGRSFRRTNKMTNDPADDSTLPLFPEPVENGQPGSLGLAPGSASEVWVLGLIERLQDKLTHRIGENITLPLDLVSHVQSALISGLRAWQDQERLDWLSRKRSPGTVHLTFNGATIAKAQSVRDVIDAAMRGPNTKLTGAERPV